MQKNRPNSANKIAQPFQRDVIDIVVSETSSTLSDSIREQILGRAFARNKSNNQRVKDVNKTTNPANSASGSYKTAEGSFVIVDSPKKKSSSFELVQAEGDNNKNSSRISEKERSKQSSFEIIDAKDKNNNKNYSRISEKERSEQSSFEIIEAEDKNKSENSSRSEKKRSIEGSFDNQHKKSSPFELVEPDTPDKSRKNSSRSEKRREEATESQSTEEFDSSEAVEKTSESSRMTHQSDNSRRSKKSSSREVETQTVDSHTVDISTQPNMNCQEWKGECFCRDCNKRNCPIYNDPGTARSRRCNNNNTNNNNNKKLSDSPSYTSKSSAENQGESSTQQTFREKWADSGDDDYSSDQQSDASDVTDFLDLPYQNNEEYMQLLHELEKKLIARNRERVRRTMQEFEKRSRQNQNLDKPVFEYCSKDDTNQNFRKLPKQKPRNCCTCCCKCGKNKRPNSDIMQNEKRWEKMNLIHSVIKSMDHDHDHCRIQNKEYKECGQSNRLDRGLHRSSWQMDPRSGEWIKVGPYEPMECCNNKPKLCKNIEPKEIDMIKAPPKCKECHRCHKKRL